MKRGFLKDNKKPLYTNYSGFSASHQAVWESLAQRGLTQKAVDITELLKQEPKKSPTTASGAEQNIGLIAGPGQSIPRPNFEDKNKSVLIPNLIHRIPSPAATQGREPSSFCMLWSSSLEKITTFLGFPSTLPKTRLPALFEIKSAPDMGLGLFAKHNIKVSELVLAERPLLVVPPVVPFVAAPDQHSLSEAEIRRTCREMHEECLEGLLNAMKIEDASAFRNLENRYGEDGFKSFGIILTNGYPMNFDEVEEILTYHAIGNKGSRINHSCTPNLFAEFDTATFSLQYTAIRDIKAGEQLFFSYCNPMQSVKERQKDLDRYKFICKCTACENATPESDKLRERYGITKNKMSRAWNKVLEGSKFNGNSLGSLLNMEKEIMKEGLDFWLPFPLLLDAIAKVYIKLGDHTKAGQYKKKLAMYHPPKALKGI